MRMWERHTIKPMSDVRDKIQLLFLFCGGDHTFDNYAFIEVEIFTEFQKDQEVCLNKRGDCLQGKTIC